MLVSREAVAGALCAAVPILIFCGYFLITGPSEMNAQRPEKRVVTVEDVVRLPSGRVALCDNDAMTIADCQFAKYLDPEWSVERVLREYPFFDPEEAAERLWRNGHRRFMFERTADPTWWTDHRLADLFAERDAAAAQEAERWGEEWRRYATQPGYRDLLAWRREYFEGIQAMVGEGDLDRIPSCEEQARVLAHVAPCGVAEYLSPKWTVDRVITEFDGLDESDTMLILELVKSDAYDRSEWVQNPKVAAEWSEDRLPEQRLKDWSTDRLFARGRLLASGKFEFLRGSPSPGQAQFGALVADCLKKCDPTEAASDEAVDPSAACELTCYSTTHGSDL